MSKMNVQRNEMTKCLPEISASHIEVLVELLRSIDMGKTTEILIDAGSLLQGDEEVELKFKSIRRDLEEELNRIRKMIFMVEKAEYYMECSEAVG